MIDKVQSKSARPFDVVLYGATSFVGRFVAEHLHERVQNQPGLRWAIAGRSLAKMEKLKQQLGLGDVPCIVAESSDGAALDALARQTKVVASTVGPYAEYGSELIRACVMAGTDYCDLTAEIPWMCRMMDQYGALAKQTGARIVHSCGFDSIPADLGTWYLQQCAQSELGEPCNRVEMRLAKFKGGFSGGTAHSISGILVEAADDPVARAQTLNPYGLTRNPAGGPQKDRVLPSYDKAARKWNSPFIMAPINTRVVQRSHALSGQPWGLDFTYDEAMHTYKGVVGWLVAMGFTAALGSFMGLTVFRPTRPLMSKILPAPGKGPSLKTIRTGFFELHAAGYTRKGQKITAVILGERDPGYGATSRMLGESAICLAEDCENKRVGGGFWTPSTAMGQKLIDHLTQYAGMQFQHSIA